eukprot:jgi/Chrzof1/1589/Cz10g13170.t1
MTMLDLDAYEVGNLNTVYYIPDYLDLVTEQCIINEVYASQAKWIQLSGRRLQNHGGIVHPKGLIPATIPRWLQQLVDKLHTDTQLFGDSPPNHVLINAYQPGHGILPHEDGPAYMPVVCILSTQSPAVIRFWRKQQEGGTGGQPPVLSVALLPRSLLIFKDDAYDACLHGIEETDMERLDPSVVNMNECRGLLLPYATAGCAADDQDQQPEELSVVLPRTGERISLTVRRVLRVHKGLALLRR